MKTKTINQNEELEFAIQDSRRHNEIARVRVPDIRTARDYIGARYDVGVNEDNQGGVNGLDVWACNGDWRLFIFDGE